MKGTMLIQHEVARIRLINGLLERAHWDMRILLEGYEAAGKNVSHTSSLKQK